MEASKSGGIRIGSSKPEPGHICEERKRLTSDSDDEPVFELKKWNAVVIWSWNTSIGKSPRALGELALIRRVVRDLQTVSE